MSQPETLFGYPTYPKFKLGEPRFPQDTFLGRYLHCLDVIDPRTLFASNKKLEESLQLLDAYKSGTALNVPDKALWEAQKLKSAVLHPDTGEKVLPPFRMSGFVPFGWITVTGMLLPNPSWPTLLFWQWMNQSHNACVNYANRNATQPQPLSKYIGAYGAAVTAACSISGGLTYFIKKASSLPPTTRLIIQIQMGHQNASSSHFRKRHRVHPIVRRQFACGSCSVPTGERYFPRTSGARDSTENQPITTLL